jgi:hypothetical protein
MIIKNFKKFESNEFSNFPTLDEIKEYFYEFTDEVNTFIDDYEFGYIFFFNREYSTERQYDYIDILNTDLSNSLLNFTSDLIILNTPNGVLTRKNLTKLIKSGKEPGYEYIFIHFDESLFQTDKLPILTQCIQTIYSHTGFRPIKSLWSEDYVFHNGKNLIASASGISNGEAEVKTLYGFEGTFVRVSDEEYKKLCDIFMQGDFTPILTKLFQ